MADRAYNVLFLCTGNTARSVLAEGVLRKEGAGRFNAHSAGSQPNGMVNTFAPKTLAAYGYPPTDTDPRVGTNSPEPVHPPWISCSPSVTTPPGKLALTGRGSL